MHLLVSFWMLNLLLYPQPTTLTVFHPKQQCLPFLLISDLHSSKHKTCPFLWNNLCFAEELRASIDGVRMLSHNLPCVVTLLSKENSERSLALVPSCKSLIIQKCFRYIFFPSTKNRAINHTCSMSWEAYGSSIWQIGLVLNFPEPSFWYMTTNVPLWLLSLSLQMV